MIRRPVSGLVLAILLAIGVGLAPIGVSAGGGGGGGGAPVTGGGAGAPPFIEALVAFCEHFGPDPRCDRDPSALSSADLHRPSPVTPARMSVYLLSAGLPESLAADFVASFEGPMTVRILEPSESFFRYTDVPDSRGSYLTRTAFTSPEEAHQALALAVTGNRATYRQIVVVLQYTIGFEGGIAGGWPGVDQTLVPDRDALQYNPGEPYY
jgi:hypothetical protein